MSSASPRLAAVRRLALAAALVALLPACARSDTGVSVRPEGIVIGSYAFTESRVLGEMYASLLREHGYTVGRVADVASREILEPALEQGLVDLVPEYQGTTLRFLQESAVPGSPQGTRRRLARAFSPRGVDVLRYAAAENRNEIVVTKETAAKLRLADISDLAPVAKDLTFGGPPECLARPLCLPGLEGTYGIHFDTFQPLDAGGPLTVAALEGNEVDVALLFTTDPAIGSGRFVVLRDDRHLQPSDNVVPVVRADVLGADQAIGPLLDSATALLTTDALRAFNRAVDVQGRNPQDVARDWLLRKGLAS